MPASAASADELYNLKIVSTPDLAGRHAGRLRDLRASGRGRDAHTQSTLRPRTQDTARKFTQGKKTLAALVAGWAIAGIRLRRGEKNQVFVAPMNAAEARQSRIEVGRRATAWSRRQAIACSRVWATTSKTKDRKAANATVRASSATPLTSWTRRFFDERRVTFRCRRRVAKRATHARHYTMTSRRGRPTARHRLCVGRERERNQRSAHTSGRCRHPRAAKKLTRALGSLPTQRTRRRQWIAYVGTRHGDEAWRRHAAYGVHPAAASRPRSQNALIGPCWLAVVRVCRTFVWAADSRALLFLAQDRGTQSIYRITLNGAARKYSPRARDRAQGNATAR